MHLLREQIKKEERLLDQDQKDLNTLDAAYRSSAALQKRQSKNLHPMAKMVDIDDEDARELGRNEESTATQSVLELELTSKEQPLIQQLRNHLDSMDKNVDITSNFSCGLMDAKAALEIFVTKNSIPT